MSTSRADGLSVQMCTVRTIEAGEAEAALLLRGGLVPPNVPRARNLNAAFAARALATLGGFIGNPAEVSRCFGWFVPLVRSAVGGRAD